MSVIIKPVKNVKKISKLVIKEMKKLIKEKPRLRIGIDWNSTTQSVLDIVKKNKKIDWYNSKIFSLSEYKIKQTHPLESELYKNFVENINVYKNNFESMSERISKLDEVNKIKHLYNFEGGVDLMIFSIDSRGNFVFNDYESGLCLINLANNGNDIYSPGIASILMAKKIICFVTEDATEKVLKTLNDKKIEKNDALTYLQLHLDCTIYTLTSLLSKKDINKSISPQNYSEFRKEIASIQNELKDDVESQFDNVQQENDTEMDDKPLDGSVPESLDGNNYNKSNLDKELQETLENNSEDDNEDLDQNLFSSDEESVSPLEEKPEDSDQQLENVEEPKEEIDESKENLFANETQNQDEEIVEEETTEEEIEEPKELLEDDAQKIATDFEKTLDENGHITDYKISSDEEIYVVENLENEDNQQSDFDEEIMSVDDLITDDEISESIKLDSSVEIEEIPDDDLSKLNLEDTEQESDLEPLNPEDLDKELLDLDSNLDNVTDNIEQIPEAEKSEESIDEIFNSNLQSNNDIPDSFGIENEIPNNFEENKKIEKLFPKLFSDRPKSEYEKLLKIIEIKTDALSSIEWLLLENKLGKLKTKLYADNYLNNQQVDESKYTDNFPLYVKLVYIPGSRPTPLLRLDNTPDEFEYTRIYTEMVKNLKLNIPRKKFTFNDYHIWNIGAYFSYSKKTSEIDLLAFSDFYKFVYLLRHLNRPLYFYLKKEDYLTLKSDLDNLSDEFKIVG